MAKENMKKCCPSLRRVFFLTTTDSKCWCAIMRSEKTHTLACNEFFGTQWIMDAAARSDAMNTPATNSSACIELRMRQRDRVQWMTAADAPSCGQKRHTRWPATNSSACNDSRMRQRIVCNELQLLIRHRAVRKDTHAGPQRIPSADVPSCGQKRHTRWPATNASACNELRMRYSTRTNPWVLPDKKRISMRTCSSMDFETTIRLHKLSINLSIYRPIYLSMYLSISPCIDLCIYRCIYLSLYLSIDRSIYLSV